MNENLQIYILLYKEVALALKINSVYSKRRLLDIHENVKVLRFPDHFSTGVYLWYAIWIKPEISLKVLCDTMAILSVWWFIFIINLGCYSCWLRFLVTYRSHHEKIVIVDNQICYIGGLDLCFGRYDTSEHRIHDYPPLIFPGKDYYNPRLEWFYFYISNKKLKRVIGYLNYHKNSIV